MRIGFATDEVTLDEKLVLDVVHRLVQDVEFIDLYNFPLVSPEKLLERVESRVIINRTSSHNKRSRFAEIVEEAGLKVVNPYGIEYVCNDKLRTKQAFLANGIKTIECALFPIFPFRKKKGIFLRDRSRWKKIGEMINKEMKYPVIIKPTGGSRGKSILFIKSPEHFSSECMKWYENQTEIPTALYQNSINPDGTYVEGFLPHPLDLRIIVSKERNRSPEYRGCLCRGGLSDDVIAKNTALGAIPLGVDPSEEIKRLSVDCMEAVAKYAIGRGHDVDCYLVGIDIIPECDRENERKKVYEAFKSLSSMHQEIRTVTGSLYDAFKRIQSAQKVLERKKLSIEYEEKILLKKMLSDRETEFKTTLETLDKKFSKFRRSKEYRHAQKVVRNYLDVSTPLPNEVNPRPDYGINTRSVAFPKLPEYLVFIALSSMKNVSA